MKKKLKKLNKVIDSLKAEGASVVVSVARYKKKSARFSTRVSLTANKKALVTEDHVMLDVLRELLTLWSKTTHKKKGK